MAKHQVPAYRNYFFGDAYKEFLQAICTTFMNCGDKIGDSWYHFTDSFGNLWETILDLIHFDSIFVNIFKAMWFALVFGFRAGGLVLSVILVPLVCIAFSAVQISVILVMMLFVYLGFLTFRFADWVYCQIKKVSSNCPNCQRMSRGAKYALPIYVCECGRKHYKLQPSSYGILARECYCGRRLKTTFFNGRQRLNGKWLCPNCEYDLGEALHHDISIPVVGGPSSGKTCFISMAISEIEKNAMPKYNLNFEYKENAALGDDYQDNKRIMDTGQLPLKTNDTRLRYYQFFLTPKGESVPNLVSICDVAGEAYESNDEMGGQEGFKFAKSFVLIVDPLSIALYREEVESTVDISRYGASQRAMEEVLDALVRTVENMKSANAKGVLDGNVAVLFTKCDIPGLDEKIGEKAISEYLSRNEKANRYDAQNVLCERFLSEYEEFNFLNILKGKFKNIQFFTCSALGHCADNSSFEPVGVEDPILWLVDKESDSINFKNKWGKA